MMSIEAKINGNLIGHVYIHNILFGDNGGNDIYKVEYYRPNQEPSVINFKIAHKKEDGPEKLSLIIYQEINKILKKK